MTEHAQILIAPARPASDAISVPVLKVFDGDGFLTRIGRPPELQGDLFGEAEIEVAARLGFIDAPELEQPGGLEARAFLVSLIEGQDVLINVLMKMDTGRIVDRYGRIVCVPYLEHEYEGCEFSTSSHQRHRAHSFGQPLVITRNVELEMVLNGWAWVIDRYGPDDLYYEALEDAQRNKRGIWAREDNVHPWDFKRQKGRTQRQASARAELSPALGCPERNCLGRLVRRHGRYGDFLGCSNFPRCRYATSINSA